MNSLEETPTDTALPTSHPHLPASLRRLVQSLQTRRAWKPAELVGLVRSIPIRAEDLMRWADFEHSAADSYGRKLVYEDDYFEVMVMSWRPGDFSAIHDHGYTQWGAVKVFGPAEHATFRLRDNRLTTLRRWRMQPGEVIGVSHDLLHQMGNPTDEPYLSLHVYGLPERRENVTADARLMELFTGKQQRVNGGVFFALPPEAVEREDEPITADFPTRFRHLVELLARLRRMRQAGLPTPGFEPEAVEAELFSPNQWQALLDYVRSLVDEEGQVTNERAWKQLRMELRAAVRLLPRQDAPSADRFQHYAEVYDKLIGQPCLDDFTANYLRFFEERSGTALRNLRVLSLGVGTGLTERHMMQELGVPREQILGIDRSPAMVRVARHRLPARQADLRELPRDLGTFDLLFSGLNVLQYLPAEALEDAIKQAARHLRPGGYFLGDFIAPDHIEQYPRVVSSRDDKVISLRTPRLETLEGRAFQISDIINLDVLDGRIDIHAAGEHRRYLPSLQAVRQLMETHFGPEVQLFDAYGLQPLPAEARSSSSTRYIVIARKAV